MARTDAINASQYRRGSSSIFQPVENREARFAPSVLPGGCYRKIFHEYANKGQARREGSGKRAHRRFHTSKRIWSGFTQPIGVEFDEMCLLTRYTGWDILRYEEDVGMADRGAVRRRVVDTNTPDQILGAEDHVEAELAPIVTILVL